MTLKFGSMVRRRSKRITRGLKECLAKNCRMSTLFSLIFQKLRLIILAAVKIMRRRDVIERSRWLEFWNSGTSFWNNQILTKSTIHEFELRRYQKARWWGIDSSWPLKWSGCDPMDHMSMRMFHLQSWLSCISLFGTGTQRVGFLRCIGLGQGAGRLHTNPFFAAIESIAGLWGPKTTTVQITAICWPWKQFRSWSCPKKPLTGTYGHVTMSLLFESITYK